MTRELRCDVSEGVWNAIEAERKRTGGTTSAVVEHAIAEAFDLPRHGIFQVSTSTAVVEGVFGGFVSVEEMKRHGDFGLGTFDGLDGEMVMVDGQCYRIGANGSVQVADDEIGIPFGVVTRFHEDLSVSVGRAGSLAAFEDSLDDHRPSQNLFVGLRAEVTASSASLRAACKAAPGEGLVEAVRHQSEFRTGEVSGTLVGFWTPPYASAFNVPGYHFHFIDDTRGFGGHVLDMELTASAVSLHIESDVHVVLPQTAEFLEADLSTDPTDALEITE